MRIGWSGYRPYESTYPPPPKNWFYIEDLSGSTNTVTFEKGDINMFDLTVEKSLDGDTWAVVGTTLPYTTTIPGNGKVYFRCKTDMWGYVPLAVVFAKISASNTYKVGGNIMSLIYGDAFTGQETKFPDTQIENHGRGFPCLFRGSQMLTDASELVLPVSDLPEYAYFCLFYDCSSLIKAPTLISKKPSASSYGVMFNNCSSLKEVTCLATDISAANCTSNWLNGVAATGTFYKDPSMSSWPEGKSGIPSGWTVKDYQ